MVRSSSQQNAVELSSPSAGEDARFFAFADTLAAKAFNSNRECEGVGSMALGQMAIRWPLPPPPCRHCRHWPGWIGLTYQAKPKEARSTVQLDLRTELRRWYCAGFDLQCAFLGSKSKFKLQEFRTKIDT